MKNCFKKLTVLILSIILLSTSIIGCGTNDNPKGENGGDEPTVEKTTNDGTHVFNYTKTSNYLVQSGNTDYKIITSSKATSQDSLAVQELVYLFKKATGITLTATVDNDLSYNENAKYISIGDTNILKTCTTLDKNTDDLVRDGYRIETEGKSIFIFSNNFGKGTLYGVYEFMHLTFNYEQYARDVMTIDQNVQTKELYDYSVKDMPDILIRNEGLQNIYFNTENYDNIMFSDRMRVSRSDRLGLPMHINTPGDTQFNKSHNSCTYILPADQYQDKWDKWYSTNSRFTANDMAQFCWTARGDEDEFEAMTDEIARRIEDSLMYFTPATHPQYEYVEITIQDTATTFCSCDACMADLQKYGTYAGSSIILMNRVAEKVKEWMAKEENAKYRRENFGFKFFAYMGFEEAPTKKDANGNWVEIDEKVIPRDDLIIYLALIDNIEYKKSIYDPINAKGKEIIEKWGSIAKSIHCWLYTTNFDMQPYYYDSFDFYNECYSLLAANNVTWCYAENAKETADIYEFKKLKSWLQNKLMWNSSLDAGELTTRWFKGMFGVAGESMEELFYDIRSYNKYKNEKFSLYVLSSIFEDVNVKEYWPLQLLLSWTNRFQEIKKEAEIYKGVDDERYNKICYYIDSEWTSPMAIMLQLYYDDIPSSERDGYIKQFKQVVEDHKFTGWGYQFNMTEFVKNL